MDLNELFFRHQVALIRADYARDREEQGDFVAQADWLATRIGKLQRCLGALGGPLGRELAA